MKPAPGGGPIKKLAAVGVVLAGLALPGCGYSLAGRGSFLPDYLRVVGIPALVNNSTPNKVTSEGKGESEPVADTETEEGRAKNRRVELNINR